MAEKSSGREALLRGALTMFLGMGTALPVLYIFGLMGQAWVCAGVVFGVSLVLGVSGFGLLAKVGVAVLTLLGGGVWLVSGGVQQVAEIVYAMALHLSGLTAALPLMAAEAAVLAALVVTVIAYVFTSKWMGPGSVLLVVVLASALWMTGADHVMLLMLPALAATATLLACSMHGEVRGGRVLPWMVLTAVIACLLAPPSGTTIEPLKEAADQLRQTVYDYFYFNQSRNVFSLASEGYYPQGSGQLGGAATPTDHPVMLVETARRVYLRGVVKDTYTGRSWLDTVGSKRYLWVAPTRRAERSSSFDMELPAAQLLSDSLMPVERVTVTMLDRSVSTMFVPQRIRSLTVGGDMVPYFNDASEVFITRDLAEGDTYTVNAPLMLAGDAGLDTLLEACGTYGNAQTYQRIQNVYTKLPDHLQSQVYALAITAAGDAQTPYAKALAVQNYLRSQFAYTLNAETQPTNVDFVANFLLNTKQGYCTHFASAMTVLCRMLGLPTRYVEGYLAEPGADGVAYVTGMEAHAWTEIYFDGFGWLTFDATPPSHDAPNSVPPQYQQQQNDEPDSTPTPSPEPDEAPTPSPKPEANPTPEPDPQMSAQHTEAPTTEPGAAAAPSAPPDDPEQDPPDLTWLWSALALLLLLLVIAALIARVLATRPETMAAKAADDQARWQVWAQAVHDQLRVLRLPRRADESPQAWLCRLADQADMPDILALLGEMENYIAYGRYVPCAEEVNDTRHIYQAIDAQLKRTQRIRLLLLRSFVPAKRRNWTRQ